jgi:Tol biopolymer transport system component
MPFRGDTGTWMYPLSMSPDGKRLLFSQVRLERNRTEHVDLGMATLNSAWRLAAPYLKADWAEYDGRISPDGRWVAYTSEEESRGTDRVRKIYVRSFPEPGQRFSVSDSAGVYPRWAPDGKAIYYWRGQTLVAAAVSTAPGFSVVSRKDLFTRASIPGSRSVFDVHPDGKRFVMIASSPVASGAQQPAVREPPRLVIVVNWLEEFKRKLQVVK